MYDLIIMHRTRRFDFPILYPEMAVLLLILKDYDTGSADDDLGGVDSCPRARGGGSSDVWVQMYDSTAAIS